MSIPLKVGDACVVYEQPRNQFVRLIGTYVRVLEDEVDGFVEVESFSVDEYDNGTERPSLFYMRTGGGTLPVDCLRVLQYIERNRDDRNAYKANQNRI